MINIASFLWASKIKASKTLNLETSSRKNNHMLFYIQNIFLSTCLDNGNAPKIQCRQSDNTEVCKTLFTCYPMYNENDFVDT